MQYSALHSFRIITHSQMKRALRQYTPSSGKRHRQYFGHNFDKFKYIVVIFARNVVMVI